MKHLFIINPAAGKGKAEKIIPEIQKVFAGKDKEYEIKITERQGHATEIAREFVQKGNCRVYSVGGDGTLNEVLNGVVGSGSSIAIIPCGSGNDFIRSIIGRNIKKTDIRELLKRTIEGSEMPVDIVKVNERYFLNISSIGFDAEVVYNARKFKGLPGISGSLAYILGILVTVFRYRCYELAISIDGKDVSDKTLLVAIANGRYYGGGMLPVPEASLNDGLLDMCIIKRMSRIKILTFFPKFIMGQHGSMQEVNFYKGRHICLAGKEEVHMNIDGEIKTLRDMQLEVISGGIRVVCPDMGGRTSGIIGLADSGLNWRITDLIKNNIIQGLKNSFK